MEPATKPPGGKTVRKTHRTGLTIHFVVMVTGLGGLALANRVISPDWLWIQWAALAWGAAFVAHLVHFERGTMATMGKKSS